MNEIVRIEFNNLCNNCKHMGIRYCKDSHCEVESFCELSGIERKLCDPDICPLIIKESEGRKMKIVTIEDENLVFDDGSVLMSTHDQDCCEWHWLDFSVMKLYNFGLTTGKPIDIYQQEFDFSHGVTFKKVEGIGIVLLDAEDNKYLICGHGDNNGYYGTNLDLVYINPNGQEVYSYDISECQDYVEEEEDIDIRKVR